MAQEQLVAYHCDVDGEEIPDGEQVTVPVTVGGNAYEADLCALHSDALVEVLGRLRRRPRRRTEAQRTRGAQVRAWAKAAGLQVDDRGRIPADVLAKYEAAQ